jgi:hypothetical protein
MQLQNDHRLGNNDRSFLLPAPLPPISKAVIEPHQQQQPQLLLLLLLLLLNLMQRIVVVAMASRRCFFSLLNIDWK